MILQCWLWECTEQEGKTPNGRKEWQELGDQHSSHSSLWEGGQAPGSQGGGLADAWLYIHFFKCWEFLRALLGSVTNTGESEGLPSPALGLVTPHLGALVVMSVQEAHHHHPGLL